MKFNHDLKYVKSIEGECLTYGILRIQTNLPHVSNKKLDKLGEEMNLTFYSSKLKGIEL